MKKTAIFLILLTIGCATPKEKNNLLFNGDITLSGGVDTGWVIHRSIDTFQLFYADIPWEIFLDTVPVSAVVIADSTGILRKVPATAVIIEYQRREQWNVRNRRYFLPSGGPVDLFWMIDEKGNYFIRQ